MRGPSRAVCESSNTTLTTEPGTTKTRQNGLMIAVLIAIICSLARQPERRGGLAEALRFRSPMRSRLRKKNSVLHWFGKRNADIHNASSFNYSLKI